MVIVSDIDGVLARTVDAAVDAVNKEFSLPEGLLRSRHITNKNFEHCAMARIMKNPEAARHVHPITFTDFVESLWQDPEFYSCLDAYEQTILELTVMEAGWEGYCAVHFASARPDIPEIRLATLGWLTEVFQDVGYAPCIQVDLRKLHLGCSAEDKAEVVHRVNADLFIDDDPEVCRAVCETDTVGRVSCRLQVRPWNLRAR